MIELLVLELIPTGSTPGSRPGVARGLIAGGPRKGKPGAAGKLKKM
jgi:hypothetical protein